MYLHKNIANGTIVGPKTFRTQDAPSYTPAKITIVATTAVALIAAVLLVLYYKWENSRRDKRPEMLKVKDQEFMDLTDKENKQLRYRL